MKFGIFYEHQLSKPWTDDEQRTAANPLVIAGQPDHIASIALFLVSDLAAIVDGHLLVVDGGATA
jgi:enoyl-[acyl-carrier-protein] reductase (NADH)